MPDDEVQDINTGHQIVKEYGTNTDMFDLLRPRLPFQWICFKALLIGLGETSYSTFPGLYHEAACGTWDSGING